MKKHPLYRAMHALPSYLGGKRRLLPWFSQHLQTIHPMEEWPELTFIDGFMGGGAVSFWAKAQGFKRVLSNDISHRSQIIGSALLTNNQVVLSRQDVLWLTQPLPEGEGWIEADYCPSVFAKHHARMLDQGFYWAAQHPSETKKALLTLVMWHLANQSVAFPTSLGTSNRPIAETVDGLRQGQLLSAKRFTDGSLKRLCQPAWSQLNKIHNKVNAGVMGGSPVQLYQRDAIELLPKISGDILYADPPYVGTTSYEQNSKVLDSLLLGKTTPKAVSVSSFSKNIEALDHLLDNSQHIPTWVISFGNQQVTLDELKQRVQKHAGKRTVTAVSKRYKHLTHVSQQNNNEEYLLMAK